jgi:6-phosphogluconolactonase (cycloisomerase 2 family)
MLKKATALLVVSLSAATWTGCGTTSNHYVFASIPATNQVVVFREDPNSGVLTALANSPFAAGRAPQAVLLHPSGKYLYVANSGEGNISLFSIAPSTGILTEISRTNTGGTTPLLMAMDSAGSLLYVADPALEYLSVFSFASDGTLTSLSTTSLGITPTGLALSPGKFVFIGGSQGQVGQVEVWGLNSGTPTTLVGLFPTSNNATASGLVVDSTGSNLFVANGNGSNSISEFSIGADGTLSQLPGFPLGEPSGTTSPVSLLIDPSGKYLYVANQGSNNLAAYSVVSGGGLTVLANSPFGTIKAPTSLAADPNGKYLMVGSQSGASLEVFLLNSGNGTLGEVASYGTGGFPSSIAVLQ